LICGRPDWRGVTGTPVAEQIQFCESLLFQAKRAYNANEIVRMKRLILLIALIVLVTVLAGSSASAVPDTEISLSASNIPETETIFSQTEASNSSASATITITMYAVDDD
jgi:hypothetical protein